MHKPAAAAATEAAKIHTKGSLSQGHCAKGAACDKGDKNMTAMESAHKEAAKNDSCSAGKPC